MKMDGLLVKVTSEIGSIFVWPFHFASCDFGHDNCKTLSWLLKQNYLYWLVKMISTLVTWWYKLPQHFEKVQR